MDIKFVTAIIICCLLQCYDCRSLEKEGEDNLERIFPRTIRSTKGKRSFDAIHLGSIETESIRIEQTNIVDGNFEFNTRFEFQEDKAFQNYRKRRGLKYNATERAIEVLKEGLYYVYAQAEINDFEGVAKVKTCSIQTVRRRNAKNLMLMISQATANRLSYPEVERINTIGHQGLFFLEKGDLIFLRPLNGNVNCVYQRAPERTFLGAFRLR